MQVKLPEEICKPPGQMRYLVEQPGEERKVVSGEREYYQDEGSHVFTVH